jgi:AcrR family transcriptional regulator
VSTAVPSVSTRRDRARAQTSQEIKDAARAELVAHGRSGIQLRPVARQVGLTAPAIYRYFPSLDDLVDAVTVDLFDELTDGMVAARDDVADAPPIKRLYAVSNAFRHWAVKHPAEFGLLFATPPVGFAQQPTNACEVASSRFGGTFAELFIELWQTSPFRVVEPESLAPGLLDELRPYWDWLTNERGAVLPVGALVSFLNAWIRLYGAVAMEVFGHLQWAVPNPTPMFDQTLLELATEWSVQP